MRKVVDFGKCLRGGMFGFLLFFFFSSLVGLTHAKAPVMMAAQQKAIA